MKQWQFSLIRDTEPFEVYVTKGKYKGQVGIAVRESIYSGTDLRVCFDGRPKPNYDDIKLHYKMVELTDGKGNPCPEPVRDMTGRPIEIDTWVVYSCGGGDNPHGLELGKVLRIGETGGLTVARMIRDGDKVSKEQFSWRSKPTRIVNDPFRALKLPVDAVTMTEWVLKDFEDLKYGGLLD